MNRQDIGLLTLKHIQLPADASNSFFYLNQSDLPRKFTFSNSDVVPLHLRFGNDLDKSFFTSLGPFNAQVPRKYVGASAAVIKRLGLKEKDEIFVSVCSAQSLSVITVRPKSRDDYGIMEVSHGVMELIMLNQVRIVGLQQPMVFHMGNVLIDLTVVKIKPAEQYGKLEPHTEVIVLDPDTKNDDTLSQNYDDKPALTNIFQQLFNRLWPTSREILTKPEEIPPQEILMNAFRTKNSTVTSYRVVKNHQFSDENIIYTNTGFDQPTLCKLTKVLEKTGFQPKTDKPEENEPFYCTVASRGKSSTGLEIYLPDDLMMSKELQIGRRLIVEPVKELPENTREFVATCCYSKPPRKFLWKSMRKIKREIMETVNRCVKTSFAGNLLIVGPGGCGKTYLMNEIWRKTTDQGVYCSLVSCKNFRGKKVDSLMKIFAKHWSECSYREPAVLILDDLDAVNDSDEDKDESGMTATYGRRVSSIIIELADWFARIGRIQLIATANSVSSLGSTMASVRGPRLFSAIIRIPELSLEESDEILVHFGVVLSRELLEKTHGFRVQDLSDLVSRGKLRAFLEGRVEAGDRDIETAFGDTVPRALRGIQMKAEMPYTWGDVGGMEDVKNTLVEIFRWPSKYPAVFASCPLRLQTGALLYGPPGCGKTLIAGALANECGMHFKSVKGPELLSKYVGASEAAVRQLFESANQAKPCLLFFDELDSLAPRRGADSSGVTDRVVNQLLTELDGVEGRSGVWVLGATSRPDLIDPALLRPGRLDRVIFCPVPSPECRLQILKVLSKSLKFSDDIRIDELAARTDGFTGADLQALLYNCQMKAVKDHPVSAGDDELVVSASHVEVALVESRTSLSENQKLKYQQIYQRFQTAKKRDNSPTVFPQEQKVTLA